MIIVHVKCMAETSEVSVHRFFQTCISVQNQWPFTKALFTSVVYIISNLYSLIIQAWQQVCTTSVSMLIFNHATSVYIPLYTCTIIYDTVSVLFYFSSYFLDFCFLLWRFFVPLFISCHCLLQLFSRPCNLRLVLFLQSKLTLFIYSIVLNCSSYIEVQYRDHLLLIQCYYRRKPKLN
jgi:hypothetical protein